MEKTFKVPVPQLFFLLLQWTHGLHKLFYLFSTFRKDIWLAFPKAVFTKFGLLSGQQQVLSKVCDSLAITQKWEWNSSKRLGGKSVMRQNLHFCFQRGYKATEGSWRILNVDELNVCWKKYTEQRWVEFHAILLDPKLPSVRIFRDGCIFCRVLMVNILSLPGLPILILLCF